MTISYGKIAFCSECGRIITNITQIGTDYSHNPIGSLGAPSKSNNPFDYTIQHHIVCDVCEKEINSEVDDRTNALYIIRSHYYRRTPPDRDIIEKMLDTEFKVLDGLTPIEAFRLIDEDFLKEKVEKIVEEYMENNPNSKGPYR